MTACSTGFSGLSGRRYELPAEEELLFLAARLAPAAPDDARLRTLCTEPLRWVMIQGLANRHGVTGLVRRRLKESGAWAHVPLDQRTALDRWQISRLKLHVAIQEQLDGILAACADAHIAPVVLKGAALAATAYPDPTLRSMADIDLLIALHNVPRLSEIMAALGYGHQELYYGHEFNAGYGYHLLLRHPAGRYLPVEVHWGLASGPERRNRLTAAALLARTIPAAGDSSPDDWRRNARVLTPVAQIVYLATHTATEGHAFGRLVWLVDLAATAAGLDRRDWDAVTRLARQARAATAVWTTLTLSHDLLAAPVPEALLAELRPNGFLLRALERALNPQTLLRLLTEERRATVKYLVVDNPAFVARLLRERLLPAPDILRGYYALAGSADLLRAYLRHVATTGGAAGRKATRRLMRR